DAIVHLLRTGCAWSALPDWAPPRSTVYEWFRRLADGGWLETIHHALLLAVRELQGHEASPTIGIIVADSACTGRFEAAMMRLNIAVEIVRRPQFAEGFVLLPKRWRVEQTFGVARFCRRLLVDHETRPHVSESMIRLA